ncbi:hypothetical protein QJS10_CPA01g02118 [Acorus calamus]|uniref:Uncharacterized protein n=1 Tax=Acorus calamus TaxID=4465 RepID=A0AAV9FJS0_ACOCL|nr:hypothetical protein QJS10_CPA01g02118 [Acorus calamus]
MDPRSNGHPTCGVRSVRFTTGTEFSRVVEPLNGEAAVVGEQAEGLLEALENGEDPGEVGPDLVGEQRPLKALDSVEYAEHRRLFKTWMMN